MLKPDIYFDLKYGKVTELIEDGECKSFQFENEHGIIWHMFILREIPWKVEGKTYYDIITPYGYGGPIIEAVFGDKSKLVDSFSEAFNRYCLSNNIVSEFIRFHPILENHKDFMTHYDISYLRKTVATNLKKSDNPQETEFSKSARKNIRRAYRDGIRGEVITSPKSIENFISIYYETMDRAEAKDYYYFTENYFNSLIEHLRNHIIVINVYFETDCIASGIFFKYQNYGHVHLSGTRKEFLHLNPAYILRDLFVKWAKEHELDLVHHGGGTSNSENDPLYQFKKRFSGDTTYNFYVGKKIYLPNIYEMLIKEANIVDNDGFFPAYRR